MLDQTPRLSAPRPAADYQGFVAALRAAGFAGELSLATSDRMVLATDNSIYQVLPEAVAFPRSIEDLVAIARLLPDHPGVVIRPRGGGTGTNGQSLGEGLVVDCSRHMTAILEINAEERWVRVQPGVIKDQLNAALKPLGLFFAPELSTSSRATIGGMVSTDACGQGSCLYGKTSTHVLSIDAVLVGGEVMRTEARDPATLAALPGRAGEIWRTLARISRDHAALIAERFPKMNRSLTGYDLAHIARPGGGIDPAAVICGAEGTLALIGEVKLNLLPIPRVARLVNVFYDDFQGALRDARVMAGLQATSVETIDSRVLGLARADVIWHEVAHVFPDAGARGVNIVEFTGETEAEVAALIDRLVARLGEDAAAAGRRGHAFVAGGDVGRVWAMRKKSVGLLGRADGPKRPLPFVEDCAVPPEALEPFIAGFRAILDAEGLDYGMFGHVDAGVLHVRPALDLTDPAQEPLIRRVTEAVEALARQHGGLLWGEHGKGVRSEFVPQVFGPLYPVLEEVKAAFDPANQLNPGKIAAPAGRPAPMMTIDGVPMRGQNDRQIPAALRADYAPALSCNGNGACFGRSSAEVMCPSYKATGDRRHSPKGRAGLVREWLRQGGPEGRAEPAFEAEVKAAMDGCLSCRACATGCPVQVDVPSFRAKFLESWYARHRRPLRDHALAALEGLLPLAARAPWLFNLGAGPLKGVMRAIGLQHLPQIPRYDLARALKAAGARPIAAGEAGDPARDVVILPDPFTWFFEPALVADMARVIAAAGFVPRTAPYLPSGKPRQVLGMLARYKPQAAAMTALVEGYRAQGLVVIGLEPAITLSEAQPGKPPTGALLPQEWLASVLDRLPARASEGPALTLMAHCTERALRPAAAADWGRILARLGIETHRPETGCCGMAGTWGHEVANGETSAKIFAQSWAGPVAAAEGPVLATGFSCRCQAQVQAGATARHPISLLAERLG